MLAIRTHQNDVRAFSASGKRLAAFKSVGFGIARKSGGEGHRSGAQPDSALPTIEVRNSGGAVAAGVIGGMILGGIIASQGPRYYGYYDGYPPYPYSASYPHYRSYWTIRTRHSI